jgi:Undecaprenyl-phosphate galactose phosphotransferase WbaP
MESSGSDFAKIVSSAQPRVFTEFPHIKRISTWPWLSIFMLILSDIAMSAIAAFSSFYIRRYFDRELNFDLYWDLWPGVIVLVLAYFGSRLYVLVGMSAPEELRRIFHATTLVFAGVAASTFLVKGGGVYSRLVFLGAWSGCLVLVPLGRAIVRKFLAQGTWWGRSVVILGGGKTGSRIIREMILRPSLGFKPVCVFDDDPDKRNKLIHGVPVIGGLDSAPELARRYCLKYAILAMPSTPHTRLLEIVEQHGHTFSHLIVIPDLFGFASLRVPAQDLGGTLGLEVRQQLLLPLPRYVKWLLDILLCVIGGILILPLILFIGILIKLESKGPVFYGHMRIGQNNRKFKAWKFRSMFSDADGMLQEHLTKHPELAAEWKANQKLKQDPRVTRMGRILRKTSFDELPQLWNVMKGEMSLVGPRPIVDSEIEKYGSAFSLYLKVLPGLTGLWQVSGRSDTSYEDRVAMDTYYVRNWSVWMDFVIVAKTFPVLLGKGAY